jgi:hypothetical protein
MELSILSFNSSMMTEILAISLSVHSTSTCGNDDMMFWECVSQSWKGGKGGRGSAVRGSEGGEEDEQGKGE